MPTVFTHDSYLIQSGEKRKNQYISVSSTANNFFDVLPVLDVQINLQTDLSISKTLKGTFNYVVFLDMPVSVNITGIYALNQPCKSDVKSKKVIQDLYTKYKIGNAKNLALTIIVNGISYDVMAISLSQKSSGIALGIMAYTLAMVGNRVG